MYPAFLSRPSIFTKRGILGHDFGLQRAKCNKLRICTCFKTEQDLDVINIS